MSKTFGHLNITAPSFTQILNSTTPRPAVIQSESYSTLVYTVFNNDEDKFFQYLLAFDDSSRLTIYCDADSMLSMLTKYWKTLYPAMTFDNYYMLLNFSFSYIVEVISTGYTPAIKLNASEAVATRTEYQSYLMQSEVPSLQTLWAETQPWKITRTQRERLVSTSAIELQLASTLANPLWRYRSQLYSMVVTMMKKEMIHEFSHDVRYGVILALVNFHTIEPTSKFNILTHTIDDLIVELPQYKFLNDPKFTPDNVDYVFSNYNIKSMLEISKKIITDEFKFGVDWAPLMKENLSFDDIINFELEGSTTRLFLNRSDYYELVNPYLIDFIFNCLRNNNSAKLVDFELK
jgi:hypothetical protein